VRIGLKDGCDVEALSRRLLAIERYKRGRARSPLGKFAAGDRRKVRALPSTLRHSAALMAKEEFGRFMVDAVVMGPASPVFAAQCFQWPAGSQKNGQLKPRRVSLFKDQGHEGNPG